MNAPIILANDQIDSLIAGSESSLYQAEFEQAFAMIQEALDLSQKYNQRNQYYSLLNHKANYLTRTGNYDSAYSIHAEVLQYSMNNGLAELEFETKYYLGVLRLFMSEFAVARGHFQSVIDFFRVDEKDHQHFIARSLTNLAFLAFQEGSMEQAISYLDKSRNYYKGNENNVYAAANYTLTGLIQLNYGEIALSKASYLKAREIYKNHNRVLNLSGILLNLATVHRVMGESSTVRAYLDSAMQVTKNHQLPREHQAVYDYLYTYHYEMGQFEKAIDYILKRDALKDSLRNTEMVLKVAKLEGNSAKKLEELQLSLLQEKLSAEQESSKIQKIGIFIAVVISIYLFVFILVYRKLIKDKSRSQQELFIKNNQLEDKTLQIAKAQKQLIKSEKMALLGRISAGIAHEINTPIGAIKGNLELISSSNLMELESIDRLKHSLTPDIIETIVEMIKESALKTRLITNIEEHKELRKTIQKFFKEVEISNKKRVVDYFVELSLDTEIHRFNVIYGHSKNLELLELAVYVVSRIISTNTAVEATEKALKILSSFKTYSFKRGWKDVKNIELANSLEVILNLYKSDIKNIKVHKNVTGNTQIEGIQDELDQVWTNLISNAIYAMSSTGELFVRVEGLSNAVSVTIEDTGGGIEVEGEHDIFEPFYTTKPEGEGSGLGLDICKQIIKNHYGSISWKNTDRGAKFIVILPRTLDKSMMLDE